MNKQNKQVKVKRKLRHNLRAGLFLLILPLAVGATVLTIIGTGVYAQNVAQVGSQRLTTKNWEEAVTVMEENMPQNQRKYAYYKIKEGQTIEQVAQLFSVDVAKLHELNPGKLVPGTTIKITPLEHSLSPTSGSNGALAHATVAEVEGMIRVTNKYNLKQPVVTNLPELTHFLAGYGAIEQVSDKAYRINKPISLDGDIRLDMTPETVTRLELRSSPNDVTCLCFDEASALIDGVSISSYDPQTQKADTNSEDGRSFIRMKNGRLDILNSRLSFLGNGLRKKLTPEAAAQSLQKEGGMYGVSWRISDDQLGQQIATGWVENNTFTRNHYGTYSYGASGMMWLDNRFSYNEVYGLDPHDDSNNALIEGNIFYHNGSHGFIVSKRCNYNIIRNNTSFDNGLHGFMLHQDSAYNVIENNVSYGNVDNYVIYESNFNIIRNNKSFAPLASHVRINKPSHNNYIVNNQFWGGYRGVYLYDGVTNTYIANNQIHGSTKALQTKEASNTVFADNEIDQLSFDINPADRLVFGPVTVKSVEIVIPDNPPLP